MAVLDRGLKQRIVGALVLVALAVIFLPMLFSREDEQRHVVVEAPAMPSAPVVPDIVLDPVSVPTQQPVADEHMPPVEPVDGTDVATAPATPPVTAPVTAPPTAVAATPPAKPVEAKPVETKRLDANNLPVSWSIQLASLSSRPGAEELQRKLRSQGYNAYIRSVDGMNRVFVGPLIERAEADRLRDQLNRQHKLKGFVVRFQPENS